MDAVEQITKWMGNQVNVTQRHGKIKKAHVALLTAGVEIPMHIANVVHARISEVCKF